MLTEILKKKKTMKLTFYMNFHLKDGLQK